MIITVMMKTTMLIAIGMVGLVVTIIHLDGTNIAQIANASILMQDLVKTIGRPSNAKKKRTKENVTKRKSTAKRLVVSAKQN